MALTGVERLYYALFAAEESTEAAPTYNNGRYLAAVTAANVSPNYSPQKFYADNRVKESDSSYISGTIAIGVDDLSPEERAFMYGAEAGDDGSVGLGVTNEVPYAGAGYFMNVTVDGKEYFDAHFFPKVKPQPISENGNTRGENKTFSAINVTLDYEAPLFKEIDPEIINRFATFAEADTWLKAKLNITTGG